jgi:flavin reductase (DIM6/NTAB) family NADH-FMN oxidoreductase RutF
MAELQPMANDPGGELTARQLRDAFGAFATGVTVVTGIRTDGTPVGITVNSFASVSLDPPLILWCLDNRSSSVTAFGPSAPFAVHVLADDQKDLALHFARRGPGKFVNDATGTHHATPRLESALCRLECEVRGIYPGGDHWIIVGAVLALQRRFGAPLVFHAGSFGRFAREAESSNFAAWNALHAEWT